MENDPQSESNELSENQLPSCRTWSRRPRCLRPPGEPTSTAPPFIGG